MIQKQIQAQALKLPKRKALEFWLRRRLALASVRRKSKELERQRPLLQR